jgi:hypothetical protein
MLKKTLFLLLMVILTLGATACLNLHVQEDVDFPVGRFDSARETIESLQRRNPDRIGRARAMHMLIYDGEERELVTGVLPLWLVKLGVEKIEEHGKGRPHDVADRYVDFDSCTLREMSRLGPGLLIQVDDEGDGTHVLLWLE